MSEPQLKKSKVSLLAVCAIIYSYTASAAYGIEDIVGWGGPGLTFLVLIIVPFIWAIPLALVSAELSSMYPETGGLYVWIKKAMGEFAGFLGGWWYFLCNVVATAVFLVLIVSYISDLAGGFSTPTRILVSAAIVIIIAFINVKGIGAVGGSNVLFVIIALAPFVAAVVIGVFQIQYNPFESFSLPSSEGESVGAVTSYGLILAMWMFCGYEAVGSVAEEIEGSYSLIPKGLFICLPVAAFIYIVPTMVGAAVVGDWNSWGAEAGEGVITFVEMGRRIGGNVLMVAFLFSAFFASLAMYNSYLAAVSRFPFVMARDNLFFKFFAKISPKYGTPAIAIVICSALNIFMSTQSFETLLTMSMALYFLPVVLYLVSALVLRITKPDVKRHYKVPGGIPLLALFILMPTALIGLAFFNMAKEELVLSVIGLATGPVVYIFFKLIYGGQKKKSPAETSEAAEGAASA